MVSKYPNTHDMQVSMVSKYLDIRKKWYPLIPKFIGIEPSNGFRCALPCDSTNATFSSINLNKSYLFPLDEDENFDFCKPYAYIQNAQNSCSIEDFDHNNTMDVDNPPEFVDCNR